MNDVWQVIMTAVLGGGVGVALITFLGERWKFRAQRKAAKEDRDAAKEDRTEQISETVDEFRRSEALQNESLERRLSTLEARIAAQSEALKLIMLDRVLWLGAQYVRIGEISFDERRRFHAFHKCYHDGLGGNGDADLIVEAVDRLPLSNGGVESDR